MLVLRKDGVNDIMRALCHNLCIRCFWKVFSWKHGVSFADERLIVRRREKTDTCMQEQCFLEQQLGDHAADEFDI
jgi:hypothetical protein